MEKVACNDTGIKRALEIVSRGGTIIYPTDTVYALGCDPFNSTAISTIYEIKGRDTRKQMPVLCATPDTVWEIVNVHIDDRKRLENFWPGALTIVSKTNDKRLITTMSETIAVRVPAGVCVNKLLCVCGPLIGTSANVSGAKPTSDPDSIKISADLMIDSGVIKSNCKSSTIITLDNKMEIIRNGEINNEEIKRIWTS